MPLYPDPEVARLRIELEVVREELRQLRSTLSLGRWLRVTGLSLTRGEQGILFALLSSTGPVSTEKCRSSMDVALGQIEAGSVMSVKVCLSRLRPKLLTLDPPIEIQTLYGFGIWLDDENRARLEVRWENRPG